MGMTVTRQAAVFLWSLVFGGGLGMCYDLFRLLRRWRRWGWGWVFFQDLLYFALYTAATFLFLMAWCQGELRWEVWLGQGLGAVFWFCTMSKIFLIIGCKVMEFGKWGISGMERITFRPLWYLSRKIAGIIGKIGQFAFEIGKKVGGFLRIDLKNLGKLLYNHGETMRASSCAAEDSEGGDSIG